MQEREKPDDNRQIELTGESIANSDNELDSYILSSFALRISGTREREELKRIAHSASLQVEAYRLTRIKSNPRNHVSDEEADKALRFAVESFDAMEEILRSLPNPTITMERVAQLLSIFKTLSMRLFPPNPLRRDLGAVKQSTLNVVNQREG